MAKFNLNKLYTISKLRQTPHHYSFKDRVIELELSKIQLEEIYVKGTRGEHILYDILKDKENISHEVFDTHFHWAHTDVSENLCLSSIPSSIVIKNDLYINLEALTFGLSDSLSFEELSENYTTLSLNNASKLFFKQLEDITSSCFDFINQIKSPESLVKYLKFYSNIKLRNMPFEKLSSFEYITDELKPKGNLTVFTNEDSSAMYPYSIRGSFEAMMEYKKLKTITKNRYEKKASLDIILDNMLMYIPEILYTIENIKNSANKHTLYTLLRNSYFENPLEMMYYTVDGYGNIEYTELMKEYLKLNNLKDRFKFTTDILEGTSKYTKDIKEAFEKILDRREKAMETLYCGLLQTLMRACDNYSTKSIRETSVGIIYKYILDKGYLNELYEDGDDIEGINTTVEDLGLGGGSSATVGDTTSSPQEDLLNIGKPKGYRDVNGDMSASTPTSSTLEALDRLTSAYKEGIYRYNVTHVKSDSSYKDSYDKISSSISLISKTLQRQLKDIKTYNTGGKNAGERTGKLDMKNIYRYKSTPDIFYKNTYKVKETDLAMGIILDVSGSMSGSGMENGRICMVLLHEALKFMRINHSIITHTSNGNLHSEIACYQAFKESLMYTPDKNYSLIKMRAQSGNCDSGALSYMEKTMEAVRNKDKICLIFSDGQPTECTDAQLKDQVKSMNRKGIKTIGIGIDFPEIAKYYPDYANGKNLTEMIKILNNILKEYVLSK